MHVPFRQRAPSMHVWPQRKTWPRDSPCRLVAACFARPYLAAVCVASLESPYFCNCLFHLHRVAPLTQRPARAWPELTCQARADCGFYGLPCCDGTDCEAYLECTDGTCKFCGYESQPCCGSEQLCYSSYCGDDNICTQPPAGATLYMIIFPIVCMYVCMLTEPHSHRH